VPASFLLAELLPFRWWYLWAMFMIAVALIAIWAAAPLAFSITAVAALVLLKWGRLRPWLVVGMVVWLAVMVGWLTLAWFVAVAITNVDDTNTVIQKG
jgi:hypothetical protein